VYVGGTCAGVELGGKLDLGDGYRKNVALNIKKGAITLNIGGEKVTDFMFMTRYWIPKIRAYGILFRLLMWKAGNMSELLNAEIQ